jgi:hypothetical protein
MAGLLDFPEGAAFGTGSPAETAQQPAGLGSLLRGAYEALGLLSKRTIGSSEMMRTQGTYDPAPMVEAAMLPMGTGAVAGVPMRAGEAVFGAGPIRRLPSMDSLQVLPHPSIQNLKNYSRVEIVDLSKARTPQDGVGGMNWEANKRGEYAPPLFEGYADKPVAVRKETGEYVILDGNHRSVNAVNRGDKNLEMYVIDAKDYAPQAAGLKPQPSKISDDDLLRELFGK